MNYEDHQDVLDALKKDQLAEEDLRQEIDDIIHFLSHPQGQWEPNIWNDFEGRPRYTFDQCGPGIEKVWAEMAANEYSSDMQPVGEGSSEDVADVLDGMMRRIARVSEFSNITEKAGKRMIATGFGAWRVVSKYVTPKSMYQDIMMLPINNAHRRVWFDCNAEMQNKSDGGHVHILANVAAYKAEKIAKRKVMSLSDNRSVSAYEYKPSDSICLGELHYKTTVQKEIFLIDYDHPVVMDEDEIKKHAIPDSMIIDSRVSDFFEVYSRKYDKDDWIGEPKKTIFRYLPVIPCYAHFDINEDGKTIYKGFVRPIMDTQRVFNYSESRKVEESILQSRKKLFMDDRVAEGYTDELQNINRDPRAVQLFNGAAADDSKLPFYETSGPTSSPALSELSENMIRNFQLTSGMPNEIENLRVTNKDSDFRFDQRTSMGQVGTFDYYKGLKHALQHTYRVILDAIPRCYDTYRKVQIVDESGKASEVEINKKDTSTGEVINNITTGHYDIAVDIGESFETRQAKANSAIMELGKINPGVIERNSDVIASNIKAPGMSMVSDRERDFLMKQGVIPESQFTEDEKAAALAAQSQPPRPDPASMIAQAEIQKAQAEVDKVQTQLLIEQAKLEQQGVKQQTESIVKSAELQLKSMSQSIDDLKKLIEANKILAETEAMGLSSPEIQSQEVLINEQQDRIE